MTQYPPEAEALANDFILRYPQANPTAQNELVAAFAIAYQLGRRSITSHAGKHRWKNSTPEARAAIKPPNFGRPRGATDSKPRTRRKKAEIEASRVP